MTDLKSQLSEFVLQVVERVDVDDVLARETVELQPEKRRVRTIVRPGWVVAAAVVFVVATVGLVPLLVQSPESPDATLDPVATTTSPDAPLGDVGAFHPDIQLAGGRASLDLTFPDGTSASVVWPADLELTEDGVFLEAAAYTETSGGPDGRVLAINRGLFEQVAEAYGGGTLLADYPGADGSTVEFWRFPAFEWDYLVYTFGDWVVMVYDYRELADERMTEDERSMWARSLTGQETPDGFLILDSNVPLHVGGPDYLSSPPGIVLRSPDGDVRLEATHCEPDDEADFWCDPTGQIRISTNGEAASFASDIRDNLEVVAG